MKKSINNKKTICFMTAGILAAAIGLQGCGKTTQVQKANEYENDIHETEIYETEKEEQDVQKQEIFVNLRPDKTTSAVTGLENTKSEVTGLENTKSEVTGLENTKSEVTGSEDTESEVTGAEDTESEVTGSEDTQSEHAGSANVVKNCENLLAGMDQSNLQPAGSDSAESDRDRLVILTANTEKSVDSEEKTDETGSVGAGDLEEMETEIESTEIVVTETGSSEITQEEEYPNTWTNTGNQAQDLAAVALTQIGYQETEDQYTKYASWYYGRELSASWNAIFVSWCADQAGISNDIIGKNASPGCNRKVIEKNPFGCPAYLFGQIIPETGDIIFIDNNSDSFSERVGIITAADSDYITAVIGDYGNQVSAVTFTAWSGEMLDQSGNVTEEKIMFICRPIYQGY